MHFLEKLLLGLKVPALTREKLLIARFRKLLENARAVMNLMEDGREKLREEYIFDRHYVTSLVDGVIERAGMMAFDASVLVPEGGEAVFLLHDRLKTEAISLFLNNEGANHEAIANQMPGPLPEEPELRMLACVIAWMSGTLPGDRPSMMAFIRKVFDTAAPAVLAAHDPGAAKTTLTWECGGVANQVAVADLEAGSNSPAPENWREVECRPLELLLTGPETTEPTGGKTASIRHWAAVTAKDRLSLRRLDPGFRIDLETNVSGHLDADFIFLFAEHPAQLAPFLPEGFHLEKTAVGEMAWRYDTPGQDLETGLARIGSALLCP